MRIPYRTAAGPALGALVLAGTLVPPAAAADPVDHSPQPVAATSSEVSLVVEEADSQQHRLDSPEVVLTGSSEANGFAVAGIVWGDSDDVTVTSVQLRTLSEGAWSAWEEIEHDGSSLDDPGDRQAIAGTDPVAVGEVDRVEARIVADGVPDDPRLTVVDPGTSSDDAAPAPAALSGSVPMPVIYPRASWGADESMMTWPPQSGKVTGTVIHHTAGTNDYRAEDVPSILRGIYYFHAVTRDWGDIGYNFLVDKFGRTWEGRFGGVTEQTIGAHALGFNSFTTGISVLGNYSEVPITDAGFTAVADLAAWKLTLHGVDVTGTMTVNGKTYPALVGHRDVGSTECPGNQFYPRLGELRQAIHERQTDALGGPAPDATCSMVDCIGPSRQVVSTDGWQRYHSSVSTGYPAQHTLAVSYHMDSLQYYWGLGWHWNRYPVTTTIDAELVDAAGNVVSTGSGSVTFEGTAGRANLNMYWPETPGTYRVIVRAHSTGMWWSNHASSDIHETRSLQIRR